MDLKVRVFSGREGEIEEKFNKWAEENKGYIKDFRVAQHGQYGVTLVVLYGTTPCEWIAPMQPYSPSFDPQPLPYGPFGPAITCKDDDPWKGEFTPVGSEPLRTSAPTMRRHNPAEQFGGGIH